MTRDVCRGAPTIRRRRGVVSVLAMMFIVVFASLSVAMAIVSQGNLRTATTYRHVNRSIAAAETGLRFAEYRINQIAGSIQTSAGAVDQSTADVLWPQLRDAIVEELGGEIHALDDVTASDTKIVLGRVPVGSEAGAATFRVVIERHPLAGENYDGSYYQRDPYNAAAGANEFTSDGEPVTSENPVDGRWVRVRVIGTDRDYSRAVQSDFRIDKKVRYAVLSRNRVMIGRNVMIKGSIGSTYTLTSYEHGHPVQMRDNFAGLDPVLDGWLDAFESYLAEHDGDGDNRVNLDNSEEAGALADATTYDRNLDGFVDAYDFFLLKYDADANGALSLTEFGKSSGGLVDEQLWQLINEYKYPAGTVFDWSTKSYRLTGTSTWIDASADLDVIDNGDGYTKIAGEVLLSAAKSAWETGAANGAYQKHFEGGVRPDPTESALTFEMDEAAMAAFDASSFDVSGYKAMAVNALASQVADAEPAGSGLTPAYTPPSAATLEATPFGSAHPYDFYARPVYENYTFRNVRIPKGTNALFVNCRFVGVTFVETETDTSDPYYNYAGMQEPNGELRYTNVVATVNGAQVSDTKELSNNLRFHNCTFEGMIASDAPHEYAHVRNKIQVTGTAHFKIDDSAELSNAQKSLFKKSTILAPQMSVDLGSFDKPNDAGEWVRLDGTIVAGVFDIRGNATIDGSIIATYEPVPAQGPLTEGGNPAAFNTTIGYFESTAGDNEGELPTGGYGKIIIRYDPTRTLPDGISGPIEFASEADTYHEGGSTTP